MTPRHLNEDSIETPDVRPLSFLEIMKQQAQEEGNTASGGLPSLRVGYDRLLQEMETPIPVKRNVLFSPPELEEARIREVGLPGPFEKSISNAQREMKTITGKEKSVRNASFHEVNKAAEKIITSLSEEGRFVCLEEVKAKLCKEFGRSSLSALGFKKDKDVPALNELIQLQAKVSTIRLPKPNKDNKVMFIVLFA